MAKYCPECGEPVEKEKARFCSNCGTGLPVSAKVTPSAAISEDTAALQPVSEERQIVNPDKYPPGGEAGVKPSPDIISARSPIGELSAQDAFENPICGEEFRIQTSEVRSSNNAAVRYTAAEKLAEAGVTWAKSCINLPPDIHPAKIMLLKGVDKLMGFHLYLVRRFKRT